MKSFILKYKHALWFSLFGLFVLIYFLSEHIGLEHHVVHIPLDDKIPFIPYFVIAYMAWYLYIPLNMLHACFTDKQMFYRQVIVNFVGVYLAVIFFFVWPSCIDFRPYPQESGFIYWLCRIIYDNDTPVNVMPSLHCYESVVIHLTTFCTGPLKHKKGLRCTSAIICILICLSSFFIKQHSVLDSIIGVAFAFTVFSVYQIIKSRRTKNDNPSV